MSVFNLFDLKDKEYYYRASRYAEANWLQGIPVRYTPCIGYDTDVNNDPIPKFADPVMIHIILVQLTKATLEKHHWISEGEDALGIDLSAINFPAYKKWRDEGSDTDKVDDFLIPIGRYSKIELPYKMVSSGDNDYSIMNIIGDAVRPLIWQCQIAPIRQQVDLKPSTEAIDTTLKQPDDNSISKSLLNIELDDPDEPTL